MSVPQFVTGPDGSIRLSVNSAADLARAIALSHEDGAIFTTAFLRALRDRRLGGFLPLLPETSRDYFRRFAREVQGPAVVLIPDDDGRDRGPDSWAQGRRAIAWAATIVLHAAGAEQWQAELIMTGAQATGRALLIECSSRTLPAWLPLVAEAAKRVPVLVVRPRGGQHPVALSREALQ
jgi:hypothetical protein